MTLQEYLSDRLGRICLQLACAGLAALFLAATGMGLYLCKKLASFLDLGLHIVSQEGVGTTVTLTFPAKENLTKL